jgi:hypothetical protein
MLKSKREWCVARESTFLARVVILVARRRVVRGALSHRIAIDCRLKKRRNRRSYRCSIVLSVFVYEHCERMASQGAWKPRRQSLLECLLAAASQRRATRSPHGATPSIARDFSVNCMHAIIVDTNIDDDRCRVVSGVASRELCSSLFVVWDAALVN